MGRRSKSKKHFRVDQPSLRVVKPGEDESNVEMEAVEENPFEKKFVPWFRAVVIPTAAALAIYHSGILSLQPASAPPSKPKDQTEVQLPFVGSYGSAYGRNQTSPVQAISFEEARTNPLVRQLFLDQIVEEMIREGSVSGIEHPVVTYDPSGRLGAQYMAQGYERFAPKETLQEGGVGNVAATIMKNQGKLQKDASRFAWVPLLYRKTKGGSVLDLGRGIAGPVHVGDTVFSTCFSIDGKGDIHIGGDMHVGSPEKETPLVSTVNDLKSILYHEFQHVVDLRDGLKGPAGTLDYSQPVGDSDFSHFMAFFEMPAYASQFESFYSRMSRPLRVFLYGTAASLMKKVYLSPYRVQNPVLFACINSSKVGLSDFVNDFGLRIRADCESLQRKQSYSGGSK